MTKPLSTHAHITGDAIRYTLQAVQGHVARLEDIADALTAERDRLQSAVITLTHAMDGEYGNEERTPEQIAQDNSYLDWLGLTPKDLLDRA